jgi:sulfur transfer complex TusBCD TusB component (DsrH family)
VDIFDIKLAAQIIYVTQKLNEFCSPLQDSLFVITTDISSREITKALLPKEV